MQTSLDLNQMKKSLDVTNNYVENLDDFRNSAEIDGDIFEGGFYGDVSYKSVWNWNFSVKRNITNLERMLERYNELYKTLDKCDPFYNLKYNTLLKKIADQETRVLDDYKYYLRELREFEEKYKLPLTEP